MPVGTAPTGSSTGPRCGSPTATSPTSRSSGPGPTKASTASSCPPTLPASRPTRSSTKRRCGPRSPRSCRSTTSACRMRTACRGCRRCGGRCRASTKPATASPGVWSAPPGPASRRRSTTRWRDGRSASRPELSLDDVRVPDAYRLPGVSSMRGPLSCLNEARYGIAWGVVGAARACFEAALDYSLERQQFGKPIGSFQLTQRKLVEMMIAVNRGMLVAHHLGRHKDAGTLTPHQISFGKMDNTRNALEVARTARGILGVNAVTLEYPVFRHMANLETVYTYEGTNEIHTLIMGQALTGIEAFS